MTIDELIATELRRQLPEVDERIAWERIQSAATVRGRKAFRLVSISAATLGVVILGFILTSLSTGSKPVGGSDSPILGDWWSTSDSDGGTQTMTVRSAEDGAVEVAVHDEVASVCSGTPSTMTGIGWIESNTQLVVPAPVYTCDDGSEPEALSGPPLEEQLRDWTLYFDPERDTLTDGVGGLWLREGTPDPSTTPLADVEIVWPQTSLEEVQRAQLLADAGDPGYTWQIDAEMPATLWMGPYDAEIFDRFVEEVLGWEKFLASNGDDFSDVMFLRCVPGMSNPLYPNDPEGGGCAPTIDEFRYEAVQITLAQPGRQGASGIWVVTSWTMLPPFEQVAPATQAETRTLMEAFLQARIDGEGAEEYLTATSDEVPFLYATPDGTPYERGEFEIANQPAWPEAWMLLKVRLYAEGGATVVEQGFLVLGPVEEGLWYASASGTGPGTTVNGRGVPVPSDFLDGMVTLTATYPWVGGSDPGRRSAVWGNDELEGWIVLVADPRPMGTVCVAGPAPADARALAESIQSDPSFVATPPVSVTIGGLPALRMNLAAAPGASVCDPGWGRGPLAISNSEFPSTWLDQFVELYPGYEMRLYLLDLPEGLSAQMLAIAIRAPEPSFDETIESAAEILDSIEFATR